MAPNKTTKPNKQTAEPVLDAVVVGAGFAGMYMVHRLREMGLSCVACE